MGLSYTSIRLTDLTNPVGALASGLISPSAFRVWLGSLEVLAIRQAAQRVRRLGAPNAFRESPAPRFTVQELARLTGLSSRVVGRALRELEREEIIEFGESAVIAHKPPQIRFRPVGEVLACNRSERRLLALPRPFLRHLARSPRTSTLLTAIGYLARGASIVPGTREVRIRGTLKASWVADSFDLSLRAVRYAQNELRRAGWIPKDSRSVQRKLNRDGSYFDIDPLWRAPRGPLAKGPSGSIDLGQTAVVIPGKCGAQLAPPTPISDTGFAPPKEDGLTPSDRKYQQPPFWNRAGVYKMPVGSVTAGRPPTLRDIQLLDLKRMDRLELLFQQAVAAGWLGGSESDALNFVASAVRAREVDGNPVRVFVGLVRRQLWRHVTQAQEERARRALARFRVDHPDWFRVPLAPPMLDSKMPSRPDGRNGQYTVIAGLCPDAVTLAFNAA